MANKIVDDTIYNIAVCLHICHRAFNSCLNTQKKRRGGKIAAIDLEDSKNDQRRRKEGKINGKYLNFYLWQKNAD